MVQIFSALLFLVVGTARAQSLSAGLISTNLVLNAKTLVAVVGIEPASKEFQDLCRVARSEVADWSLEFQQVEACVVTDFIGAQGANSKTYAQLKSKYGTLVQIENNSTNKKYTLSIVSLGRTDNLEPELLSWNIKKVADTQLAIKKILRNYAKFQAVKEADKKKLLSYAIGQDLNYDFADANFAAAYSEFARDPVNARYMAAGLEISAALAVSVISYYSYKNAVNPNLRDWQFNSPSEAAKAKLNGSGVRFDDNAFRTNKGHYYAGMGYDLFARTAGTSRLQAFLFTLTSSSFWEYIGEYREVVSINDQLNTTFGGFIMGETIFQMTKIFKKHSKDNVAHRILSEVFNSPAEASAIVENFVHGEHRVYEDLKLSEEESNFWSKLDFYAAGESFNGRSVHDWGASGQVINIPNFTEAGKVDRTWLNEDTVATQLDFEMASGSQVSSYLKVFAKITLAAMYQKNMALDQHGRLEGYQMYIGPAMALDIRETKVGNDFRTSGSDYTGMVHVLGGTADVVTYYKGNEYHMSIDLYGDFAMVHSPAFDVATSFVDDKTLFAKENCGLEQSVLCHEGYYYSYGSTAKLNMTVRRGPVEIGASASASDENIINQRSRFLETAGRAQADDIISSLRGWVAVEVTSRLRLEFGVEKYRHLSNYSDLSVNPATAKISDTIKFGRVIYRFD